MDDVERTIKYLTEAEELGNQIVCLREEIMNLHKRANETREAASELKRCDVKNAYMYEGALLVKNSKEDIMARLTERHRELQSEIKEKGDEMRKTVFRLQDLEMQMPFTGKDLMPLDKNELNALSQVWGGSSS